MRSYLKYEAAVHGPWLRTSLVVPHAALSSREALVDAAAAVLAPASGLEPTEVRDVFLRALSDEGYSLGKGVAIPHVEVEGLDETLVCLVTTRQPVALPSIDGVPPDVFLFVLSRRDPRSHLLLLARLARLAQSRTFLTGLRGARSAEEAMALVDAADQRQDAVSNSIQKAPATTDHVIVLVSVSGEKLVDAILLSLVTHGFEAACVVEAQSLRDAAAHEVPLFAGFRDIFGDPGGRRLIVVDAPAEEAAPIMATVEQLCEEHRADDAAVWVLPVHTRWRSPRREPAESPGGH